MTDLTYLERQFQVRSFQFSFNWCVVLSQIQLERAQIDSLGHLDTPCLTRGSSKSELGLLVGIVASAEGLPAFGRSKKLLLPLLVRGRDFCRQKRICPPRARRPQIFTHQWRRNWRMQLPSVYPIAQVFFGSPVLMSQCSY